MINQAVAKRYGKALLQIALENNALDAYQQDLETVVQTIEESHDLDAIWLGKEFDNETRKKVVKELFDSKVNQNIVNLLCVIVDKGREPFVRDVLEMYKKYADEARNVAYADVVSAYPLTAEQEASIAQGLGKMSGKDIRLNVSVDNTLLGGVKVTFDDKVYDGTATARLLGMKNKLQEIQS